VGDGHSHHHRRVAWADATPGLLERVATRLRALLALERATPRAGLGQLPGRLQRDPLAPAYRDADRSRDHARAAETAVAAMEAALGAEDWWVADAWAHRALWHFEQEELTLEAARQARRIGDLRWAAGDPASARRYYAEAIDEARDIGAEHEQGLAALGLGRALLDLGSVSEARRLASAAITLLERSDAPAGELESARHLLGIEVAVGEGREEQG
jgi:tetratricopeptide (TPR) repeat protein